MFQSLGLMQADEASGFSGKRLCVGCCGVLPSFLWAIALIAMQVFVWGDECEDTENTWHPELFGGHIKRYIWFSVIAYVLLVILEIIEGCIAGEPDLHQSPQEMAINCGTSLIFLFIYVWNYYGVIQIFTTNKCEHYLLAAGWATLIGNNVTWFMTVGAMIGAAVCNTGIAVADYASGDRL